MPPLYTTAEAVRTYAENIRSLTRREATIPKLLTTLKKTKDPEETVNDVLFCLSVNNAITKQRQELITVKKWFLAQLSDLCSQFYVVYTQIPESREAFTHLARLAVQLTHHGIPDSEDNFGMAPVLKAIFDYVRLVSRSGIYALPKFVQFCVFDVGARLHDSADESDDMSSDGEIDLEEDPTAAFTEAKYLLKNPYGQTGLFKCPQNLVRYLGPEAIIDGPMDHTKIRSLEDNSLQFDVFSVDIYQQLMLEGAARQLGMLPTQLAQYVNRTTSEMDVVEDTFPGMQRNLFADVAIRPITPPHSGGR